MWVYDSRIVGNGVLVAPGKTKMAVIAVQNLHTCHVIFTIESLNTFSVYVARIFTFDRDYLRSAISGSSGVPNSNTLRDY